jgi:hypothetical protein
MLREIHVEKPPTVLKTSEMPGVRNRWKDQKDHEGLIPAETETYFVVDCPSLHIIPAMFIARRRQCETDV